MNYSKWRAAVRKSFSNGVSNPLHQGPWGNPGMFRQPPSHEFQVLWPHFGPVGGLALTLEEAITETQTESTHYNDGTPTYTRTDQWVQSRTADYAVDKESVSPWVISDNINLLDTSKAYRIHSSATAYGEGLYDCEGSILVFAPVRNQNAFTRSDIPAQNTSSDLTSTESFEFRYRSDVARINGLTTFCRVTIGQGLHGPYAAFREEDNGDTIVFQPVEVDPDGVPGTELYFTDTFLASLQAGTFTDSMDRLSGSEGRTRPGAFANVTNIVWSHSWSRSGAVTLAVTP